MTARIAVLGAGGIGGPLAALLTRAGHDVVVIDQWAAHVDAMKANGLRVTIANLDDPEDDFTIPVRAFHLHEVCTLQEKFGVVFVCCKSYDTRWMVTLIEPYVHPGGVVVSVQNSLNNEWIAPIVGLNRGLGCVLLAGGELLEPGWVWKNRPMARQMYAIGELTGARTARAEGIARILSDAGSAEVITNFWGLQWSKLTLTTFSAALSALSGTHIRTWDLADNPRFRQLAVRLYREGTGIGDKLGYGPVPLYGITDADSLTDDELLNKIIEGNAGGHSRWATNMVQQDLLKGRPTEVVGYFNGLVARKGAAAGIPTPFNDAVTAMFLRLERGNLTQDIGNLDLLTGTVLPVSL